MLPLNLQEPPGSTPFSFFVLGFRPFFLLGAIFSAVAMLAWMASFSFSATLSPRGMAPYQWHAHEMLFGFALAIITGFLLTAIKNWTGVQTLQNRALMLLISLWLGARICLLAGDHWLVLAAAFDIGFNLLLFYAVIQPILRVRQWSQLGIIAKILLLGVCNGLFYLGVLGLVQMGVHWGLYGGLYLVIALVMTLGRRVMPSFIERGVGYPVKLKNSRLLDISSLLLFVGFALSDVMLLNPVWTGYFAAPLFIVSVVRLVNWHTIGIWRAPLLWGLYVAFIFITIGFLLFAILPHTPLVSRSIALHAFTFGGIGLITLSMMSRVTLGHTGRDIREPFRFTGMAQALVLVGALLRIVAPLLSPDWYNVWIVSSQMLWIGGFMLFTGLYFRALTQPRIDGRAG